MYDELIKNLRGRSQFLLPHYGEETSYDSDLMKQAADAIEEQQAQIDGWIEQERNALLKSIPKWIPVTERLPKEEKTVLAFGTLGVAWLDWRHDNKWCCYGGVTHWMPLPEPPKEE